VSAVPDLPIWKASPEAAQYLPELAASEINNRIPVDLLARIAYQESHWRPEIVSGEVCSRAGCMGLMQLNPIYYPYAGVNWHNDIGDAAAQLVQTYRRFNRWRLAVMSYNWGQGNVHHWLEYGGTVPQETEDYVREVLADVPVDDGE
jgi:soluble lytic murein transglycosylase-like protein